MNATHSTGCSRCRGTAAAATSSRPSSPASAGSRWAPPPTSGILAHEDLVGGTDTWRDWYGNVPAWAFTHRDLPAIPGIDIRFVQGDVAPVHAQMRAVAGDKDIWLVGGGELVGAFVDAGLLDEIHLGVQPVLLGAGAPLLPRRLTSHALTLQSVDRSGQASSSSTPSPIEPDREVTRAHREGRMGLATRCDSAR